MPKIIDPWGSELVNDYKKVIKDFGMETFSPQLFPEPNRIMRRMAVFAARDQKIIAQCIKEKKRYYVLTGIMPSSEKIHFGNKMVVENMKYFQDHGADTYIVVADLESATTRGITLEEAQRRALDFHIPAYIALGLNPKKTKFYFQSENKVVMNLAYEFAKKVTLNEFRAIYGSADPSRIMAAVTQVADIVYPQLEERMPGIIPVGVDQDPHIRLTRDVVARTKTKYKFFPPSAVFNKYTPSLDGKMKMSKSHPESCISLPEDPKIVAKKLRRALSGGRVTLEEHRRLGGQPEKDMVFEMLKLHLVEDDKELQRIYDEYKSGRMHSGELKDIGCDLMTKFLKDFTTKLEKARKQVDKLEFIRFS